MIDVKVGDFIQLISFNRLIKKYDGIVLDDGAVETNRSFYTPSMCDAIKSGGLFRVVKVIEANSAVFVDVGGYVLVFYLSDIEHVYRTKMIMIR